ncbi:MAG: dTDP-4-dehydrorhamnose reductase [Pyrinomonadaceae bacterium MAG19_C2-C3]|nr:dTDP-4-dehydrorhamnose reductase [Pyrinomonadaceae bacterium MAG19_C2-C3]
MNLFVTGAHGMVGRAVVKHAEALDYQVASFTRSTLDITDADAVTREVARLRPDALINCAAWTDVDGCETDAKRAYAVNAGAVENLARAANKSNACFVTISTDYVFDGAKDGFYTQRDEAHPLSIYGQSKLDGERRAQAAHARTVVVRTGWVYGTHGTNFLSRVATDTANLIKELAARGANIKAINDSYGSPTAARDLAARLCELARLDLPGIYHVVGGGAGTDYATFARHFLEAAGFREEAAELETVSFHDLKRPAPRPVNSRLRCLLSEHIGLAPLPAWNEKVVMSDE